MKFSYLYRDSGNYKKFCSVIFTNTKETDLSIVETLIKSKLIWDLWFYADEWKLPEIFTDICDFRIDPTWHEFENVEYTSDEPSTTMSLDELMEAIKEVKRPSSGLVEGVIRT